MPATIETPIPEAPGLRAEIMGMRRVDNLTNLKYLAVDYVSLIATLGGAIAFAEFRAGWGLAWGWNVPVFALAVILVGALQHRLSGLAHEAAHHSLLRNRFANDLVADVFCMYPILATIHFYRLFHLAHHRYTNDPERDPDLVNLGAGKGVDDFPMSRLRTILAVYFRAILMPVSFARYGLEYIYINCLGKGGNVLMEKVPGGDAHTVLPRFGTILGLIYLALYNVALWRITATGRGEWLAIAAMAGLAILAIAIPALPAGAFFRSPFRQPYTPRVASFFRLGFYTLVFAALAHVRWATGGRSAIYPVVLWWLPLTTTFMFFMFLRDIYQHTNADDGRLTHSRVFHCDPFTRWAVFVHGQDMHVPHHLYPAIPHYRLQALHELLKESDRDYAEQVVECRGTFANEGGAPTILDVLTQPAPVG